MLRAAEASLALVVATVSTVVVGFTHTFFYLFICKQDVPQRVP
jgi:hypothetical protein